MEDLDAQNYESALIKSSEKEGNVGDDQCDAMELEGSEDQ